MVDKLARMKLIFERLEAAPPCSSADEALVQLASVMRSVEDEFTTIPNNPAQWKSDGRLYPPQEDARRLTGNKKVVRYRNRKHDTWIGQNGAMKITGGDVTWLDKPGSDGKTITTLMAKLASKP